MNTHLTDTVLEQSGGLERTLCAFTSKAIAALPLISIYDSIGPGFRCEIIRGGMEQYLTPMGPSKLNVNPIFEIGPLEPRFSEWLVFEASAGFTPCPKTLAPRTLASFLCI